MIENSPPTVPNTATITRFSSGREFLSFCGDFLGQNEAHNNLLLGIVATLDDQESPYKDAYLAVTRDGAIDGAFMWTPPFKLVCSYPTSERALRAVLEDLKLLGRCPPGFLSESSLAARTAIAWREVFGSEPTLHNKLFCYALSQVQMPSLASGNFRRANDADLPTLFNWSEAFSKDVNIPFRREIAEQNLRYGISKDQYFIWEDPRPVSMMRVTGTTPSGIRVSHVYTPPEDRGHGYASSLVAQVSELQITEGGRKFCFLFTDSSNPTTNRIYQRIGYEKLCDFDDYDATGL